MKRGWHLRLEERKSLQTLADSKLSLMLMVWNIVEQCHQLCPDNSFLMKLLYHILYSQSRKGQFIWLLSLFKNSVTHLQKNVTVISDSMHKLHNFKEGVLWFLFWLFTVPMVPLIQALLDSQLINIHIFLTLMF